LCLGLSSYVYLDKGCTSDLCLYSVDVGEALDLHNALQWLSDMQLDNVDFETDSKTIVDAFHATRNELSEFGCITSSYQSLFSVFIYQL